MKRNYLKLFLIPFFVVLGCDQENNIKGDIETIKLYEGLENSGSIKLSQIGDTLLYIPIETNENSFVYLPEQIDVDNVGITLMDRKTGTLARYDLEGKFVRNLVTNDSLFSIKEFGSFYQTFPFGGLYLHNRVNNGSIFKISTSGELEKELCKNTGLHVCHINNELFCHLYPKNQQNRSNGNLIQITNGNKVIKSLLKQRDYSSDRNTQTKINSVNSQLYYYDDSISIWEGFCDTIYRLSSDLCLTKKYYLDYGNYKIPVKTLKSKELFRTRIPKFAYLYSFVENSNFIFFEMSINKSIKCLIYDKSSHQIFNIFNKGFQVDNDIDGGLAFWPTGTLSDGRLYMFINADVFIDHINSKIRKSGGQSDSISRDLLKLYKKTSKNDNPIIVILGSN